MSMWRTIVEFHKKFIPDAQQEKASLLRNDLMSFRINFLKEELCELEKAVNENNLEEVFDALIDLTYVAMGTAWMMNLPWEEGWLEVHSSNMRKIKAEDASQSKRGHSIDIVKPKDWIGPNLKKILDEY